jgi:hypothetical protein
MKNIIRFLIAFISISAISCTDDIKDREVVSVNTAPTLKTPSTGFDLVLDKNKPNDLATTVVWDYAIYNGASTIVTYSIEFAAAGTQFAKPTVVATSANKFKNFTVDELNSAALSAGFAPFLKSSIDVRVLSSVGTTGSLSQPSNSYTIKLTPYPAWPNWGIIGSATAATTGGDGWVNDANLNYDLATKKYSITIPLTAGGAFKFRLDDSWTDNFGDDGNNLTLDAKGADIPVTVTGTYKIVADFTAKTYTITKL